MPNNITNIINIWGDKGTIEAIQKFMATTRDGETLTFDFNTLIPMPEDIRNTSSPSTARADERNRLVGLYGADNWYDWANKYWGTKWNAYNDEVTQSGFQFDTAWATPEPILRALAQRFPTISFTVLYADEDIGNNCGIIKYANGGVHMRTAKDGDKHFAFRVKCG